MLSCKLVLYIIEIERIDFKVKVHTPASQMLFGFGFGDSVATMGDWVWVGIGEDDMLICMYMA